MGDEDATPCGNKYAAETGQLGDIWHCKSVRNLNHVDDQCDIAASWTYADGVWTLELGRQLVTGSEFDVQFDDLTATDYFGVAAFDNAQVRHAFAAGATPFVFQP